MKDQDEVFTNAVQSDEPLYVDPPVPSMHDRLCASIVSILDGDILPLPRLDDPERNAERVALAVQDATGLPMDRWDRLDAAGREPWLRKTLDALTADPDEWFDPFETEVDHERKAVQKDPVLTSDEKMWKLVALDPRYAALDAKTWATTLKVTPHQIRANSWWKTERKRYLRPE